MEITVENMAGDTIENTVETLVSIINIISTVCVVNV